MSSGNEVHVVLGATGGIGSALIEELVRRGHRVRAVSRSGSAPAGAESVEAFRADVSKPEAARAACSGASVVYHAAQPPYTRWRQEFPDMTDAVIEGAASARAKLVFADNLYMYGPGSPQPMTEETPQRATGKKGRVRILIAERLLGAYRTGRIRVAIGRASDYYGPGGTGTIAGDTVFGAAVLGKTVWWPGPLKVPHQFNYLPDLARALITLGKREEADGEVFHLPAADPITGRRFLDLVSAEVGHSVKARITSKTTLGLLGVFSPFMRELVETMYQFEVPFYADASKYERAFGSFELTPHEEAIARTVAWFSWREKSNR
jgi:nucleoside-diphosphate-sugar epimerase